MIKSRMRWGGNVARMGEEKKNAYRILVGKSEKKKATRKT
jgi:ribosomal protein S16